MRKRELPRSFIGLNVCLHGLLCFDFRTRSNLNEQGQGYNVVLSLDDGMNVRYLTRGNADLTVPKFFIDEKLPRFSILLN